MGRFSQIKKEVANDTLINAVDTDTKFESLKEILTMLGSSDATKTFSQLVGAEIAAAIDTDGAITTWADGRYEPKSAES